MKRSIEEEFLVKGIFKSIEYFYLVSPLYPEEFNLILSKELRKRNLYPEEERMLKSIEDENRKERSSITMEEFNEGVLVLGTLFISMEKRFESIIKRKTLIGEEISIEERELFGQGIMMKEFLRTLKKEVKLV